MTTRTEKLAEARRLLATYAQNDMVRVIGLTLDLIETSEAGSGASQSAHDPPHTSSRAEAPESAAFSPAPDFAAMAAKLWQCNTPDSIQIWLGLNWPRPAPAVGRDWKDLAVRVVNLAHAQEPDRYRWVEAKLREVFGQDSAPALDVEALAMRAQHLHDCNSSVTVRQCVEAAAREMLKGGVK